MSLPNCPKCGRDTNRIEAGMYGVRELTCSQCSAENGQSPEVWPEGRKDDQGKMRWGLVPFDAVGGIVRVLDFGAKKYSDRNWEQGMDWQRCFDALMRHMTAWWAREPADPETGFSHLWHAGCCILFLIAYEMRGVGKDTRPNAAPHN